MTNRRNLLLLSSTTALVGLVWGGCASKQPSEPFRVRHEQAVTMTATVKSVDQKTRLLVLEREDGQQVTIHAGEEVRNLAQVEAGDVVIARYFESLAAEVRPPTAEEKANPLTYSGVAEAAELGQKPGAGGARMMRFVGTITAIDKATQQVTLTDLDGGVLSVKARDPRNLDKVKVGDPVVLTYTEAMAILVEPAPKK
jgi:hypothetical protein